MMEQVLDLVRLERARQEVLYGSVNHLLVDGTGPQVQWLLPYTDDTAEDIQYHLRLDYNKHENLHGLPTWAHLVREEVAEAFQETDPELLVEELVQVAALCVSWVERIFGRMKAEVENDGQH